MVSSKLRIRIGEVEIDYEGTEEFLKQELPQLLKTAMELHKASGATPSSGGNTKKEELAAGRASGAVLSLTTASIAAKLGSKSGSDLLTAAAAHLALVKKKEPFTRQQLLDEMQSATSYYKTSYSANLSKYMKTAIQKDGPLSETATNAYALKAATRADLEKKLADH
jgi:hypothetical protein